MNIDLAGKKAVVAGGSRGIGRAIAVIFAEAGADVSICARGAEALAKARDDIARLGHKTHAATCDLADAAAIPRYIDEAANALGGIDVLVNNASGFGTSDDEAGWAASISVDLMATVRATRAALPYIEKSEGGSIINISSISGFRASARTPPYGAVKAAILEYTQTLAAQLARKQIRVNCIAPGSIEFPGGTWERAKNNNPPLYAAILRSIPFGRLGQPEEVARVALFLASPLAGLGDRPEYRGRWRPDAVSRPRTGKVGDTTEAGDSIEAADSIAEALAAIRFDRDGLVPAVAQQYDTGEILMVAWMNRDAVRATLTEGQVCYWSRSRGKLWRKGETSGQVQRLHELRLDCDGDTVLLLVDQHGVACHTGRRSCFFRAWREDSWQSDRRS